MSQGATGQIGVGNVCSFQDPNYTDAQSLNRLTNLTGGYFKSIWYKLNNSGTTLTGQTSFIMNYADPSNPSVNLPANVVLNLPQVSQLPVQGNPNVEQSYLQYATDVEYFQLITGFNGK